MLIIPLKDFFFNFLFFNQSNYKFYFQNLQDLDTFNKVRESQGSKNLTPYVAVLTDPLLPDEPVYVKDVYVIINSISFKIESKNIVEAVDCCYKSFFSLIFEEFTPASRHVFTFLQNLFIKIIF